MKIVFNLDRVGLGNNGGSRTIIRCAETLSELGATVILYGINQYTWHKAKNIIFKTRGSIPECDVIIATGFHSVPSTIVSKAKRKLYYIRGLELWQATEQNLLKSFRQLECIVNSKWLLQYFKQHQIFTHLIYPGLDTDWFKNLNQIRSGFGALYSNRHKTKRHADATNVGKRIGIRPKMLNIDIKNANPIEMNQWYNQLKIWFAPTELEGLHNPPIEAALSGCALVCTNYERAGMSDYAIHDETALIYDARDLKLASEYVKRLLNDEADRDRLNQGLIQLLKKRIGTREYNMEKLLDIIECDNL